MKKIISLFCVLAVLIASLAVCAVSASAADAARTIIDVKKGDTVTYVLNLGGCKENVVCADYSVYYDSSVLKIDGVADYTNSFDDAYWGSIINTDSKDEIFANFINVNKGVDFSEERPFISVKFTAIADGSTHISYYIRDMAGNSYFDDPSHPVISDYLFTCDVTVNSTAVLEDAQPELNVEKKQDVGSFVNSVNGKSEDADVNISEEYKEKQSGNSGNSGNSGSSGNSGNSGNSGGSANSNTSPDSADATNADGSKSSATPDNVDPVTTIGASDTGASNGGSSTWLWIVIAVIAVVAAGGCVLFFKKKKA